jgi:GSH-dependent disulfide-bond oxidoreductase
VLELYTSEPNTFFLKPLIALAESQTACTIRYFDAAAFEQFDPGFPADVESQLQLEREGPLLVHDGTLICSSFFMLEYLAELLPGAALMPAQSYDAYRARAWGQVLGLQLGSIVPRLGCLKYLRPRLLRLDQEALAARIAAIEPRERRAGWQDLLSNAGDEAQLEALRERLRAPLARVEKALAASPWLAGAAYSIADIDAFAMLRVLPDLAPGQLNPQATPHTVAWLERIAQRPAVHSALARARTAHPEQHFVPGVEAARWG